MLLARRRDTDDAAAAALARQLGAERARDQRCLDQPVQSGRRELQSLELPVRLGQQPAQPWQVARDQRVASLAGQLAEAPDGSLETRRLLAHGLVPLALDGLCRDRLARVRQAQLEAPADRHELELPAAREP